MLLVLWSGDEGLGKVGVDVSGDVDLIAEAVGPPFPANHRTRVRGYTVVVPEITLILGLYEGGGHRHLLTSD